MNKLFLASVLIFCLTFPSVVQAVSFPFGGRIIAIYECACTAGFVVFVGPPRPGIFVFQPGISKLYATFTPFPGAKTVGSALPGGVCMAGTAFCFPIPVLGTILHIGTSLPSL